MVQILKIFSFKCCEIYIMLLLPTVTLPCITTRIFFHSSCNFPAIDSRVPILPPTLKCLLFIILSVSTKTISLDFFHSTYLHLIFLHVHKSLICLHFMYREFYLLVFFILLKTMHILQKQEFVSGFICQC